MHLHYKLAPMSIDFTLTPDLESLRLRVRAFVDDVVKPTEAELTDPDHIEDRAEYITKLLDMRTKAQEAGIWLPHMPPEWGGMGLGHVELAMVQAEAAKSYYGPFVINCMAPDEGNMHTLLHWGTDAQKEKYLRPLCEGTTMSCFAMTEPEVAGSDPTLIRTTAVQDGDEWVINGHKWFISNARRAGFAILIARTEDDPDIPAGGQHRVHRRHPVRRVGPRARDRDDARLHRPLRDRHRGPAGAGREHPGRARQGPQARPVPPRSGPPRALHALDRPGRDGARHDGRPLAEPVRARLAAGREAGHPVDDRRLDVGAVPGEAHGAARRVPIDNKLDFSSEVSMTKHFVANMLGRVIDRSIQVHGALGYSTDTPLARPVPARPLGALGRRRRRGAPDAHRPAHHRRLPRRGQHPPWDRLAADLRIRTGRAACTQRPSGQGWGSCTRQS